MRITECNSEALHQDLVRVRHLVNGLNVILFCERNGWCERDGWNSTVSYVFIVNSKKSK